MAYHSAESLSRVSSSRIPLAESTTGGNVDHAGDCCVSPFFSHHQWLFKACPPKDRKELESEPATILLFAATYPPTGFAGRLMPFALDPPPLGSFRRFGRSANLGPYGCGSDHRSQLFQAILAIAPLIARQFGSKNQLALGRDPGRESFAKSGFDFVGNTGRTCQIPAEDGLGGDLVDVLSSWTARAGKTPLEFVERNADGGIDFEHGNTYRP